MFNKPAKYRIHRHVLLAIASGSLLMFANSHAGMNYAEIEKINSNWKCQWCPYKKEPLKEGKLEAGIGGISNDSFKHGKYTGLDEQGSYFVGNGHYEYKNSDSSYVNVEARDIGLDSRQLEAEGGLQGRYDLELQYSMLPSLNSDSARTPYRGGSNQSLPAGWVQGAATSGMTELANSLRDVDLYTERETIDVGATYHASPSLSYDLNFEQQTRQGKKAMGLDFFFASSALLAVPVDTTTKQGGIKANYRARQWMASLGYNFSNFANEHESIYWENAYSNPAVTAGQAALEPENEMQQITLDGSYHFSMDTRATIAVAFGRMTQNADYLPYTVNGTLAPPPLPRSSLDGEVNTFNSTLRLNSRWNKDWNYSVRYRHSEQSNETPRATYDYVIADTALSATARTNLPYSFRERELSLQGQYQIDKLRHISLDYKHEIDDRTYQEVETSNEDTLSARYRSNAIEKLQWSLGLMASDRKGDEYTPVADISPPEDTLLRKYNLADRKRKMAVVSLSYSPADTLQLSAFADYAADDYSDSDVGLQESRQTTVSLELQYQINKALNVSIDYSATNIDSSQAGTTWDANNKDVMKVAHVGMGYEMMKNKLTLGADITLANAIGDNTVSTGNGFPDLESTRKTLTLFADYSLDERSVVHMFVGYEDYKEDDWATTDVAPNTLDRVLTLGETSPSYNIGLFAISYKSRF